MATTMSLDEHMAALRRHGTALRTAAATAGPDAKVPTCPAWTVHQLVAHQGMVHRWAAATLRGERDHDTKASLRAAAAATPDALEWYSEGLEALLDTIAQAPDDASAPVFLNDAPPPRRFWARRQAHETTMHGMDAVSATLGRWPTAADVSIDVAFAVDGLDELLVGFVTRGKGRINADPAYTLLVRTDEGHAWTLRIGDGPVETTTGGTDTADAVFSGSAVQLYLGLWNRSDEMTVTGRDGVLADWREKIRIRWG